MSKVTVVGSGLAGSEASIYLAKRGHEVDLIEMRPKFQTGAHKTDYPAELVCSNSLGSLENTSASALLKSEAEILGSSLFPIAKKNSLPAGNSLAVDRIAFCKEVYETVKEYKNINYIVDKYTKIDVSNPVIIATGPLTSSELCQNIKELFNEENFHFYDAVAPIVEKDSIDFSKAFYASRWDKGSADFINCPMNKEEYDNFYNILINAQRAPLKEFEANYFEGCMPIEIIASRGVDTLRFGPMKPVGLFDRRFQTPFKKNQFYAVVQLRQDDKIASMYNLVGFQTNLKWGEQKKLISAIPSLENANILRYGVMHANTFINSPKILNKYLQTRKFKNVFFAGQLTGVEGYCESISTGLLASINMDRYLNNLDMIELDDTTMLGALVEYITFNSHKNFQPVNSNWGIVRSIDDTVKIKDKKLKNQARFNRAITNIKELSNKLNKGV